ncbi:DUF3515 domain-containing protein [Nocardia sp. 2]|uniref:DUF3515 domain-containing protein n=1 Tax=Nocardia acididurans TaxID=2802282 RepID=A0ABS1MHF0_9NOCA|nr:DUF3515 domain-containing protein [Nocardia acididurans]MBL1079976.1 DUF3515 domain-containing protein [Nocardia acididurans]
MSNDSTDASDDATARGDSTAVELTKKADGGAGATGSGTSPGVELTKDAQTAGDTVKVAADSGEDTDEYSPQRSPALIATAVALPIALVVGVIVAGVLAGRNPVREPLALGSVPAPTAEGPACTALLPALPADLGDYTTAELRAPAPTATKAWQLPDGGEPIVLRCGLDRPLEFNRASPLQIVNGVNWFEVRDETSGVTSGTWFAVDRGTYIAVTMANDAGPTPLQEISDTISETIPQQPLDPGPLPN